MVPWLGVCVPNVVDTSSIPGQGAKISHVIAKKEKKKRLEAVCHSLPRESSSLGYNTHDMNNM